MLAGLSPWPWGWRRGASLLSLLLCLSLSPGRASCPTPVPSPRLLAAGLTEEEQAVVAQAALGSTGVEWQLKSLAPRDGIRLAVLEGLGVVFAETEDADDVVFALMEALDAVSDPLQPRPVLVTAVAPSDGDDGELLDGAVAAHLARYDLDVPLPRQPTSWSLERATVVRHARLDGAFVANPGCW